MWKVATAYPSSQGAQDREPRRLWNRGSSFSAVCRSALVISAEAATGAGVQSALAIAATSGFGT
jgi:hypothetical protein